MELEAAKPKQRNVVHFYFCMKRKLLCRRFKWFSSFFLNVNMSSHIFHSVNKNIKLIQLQTLCVSLSVCVLVMLAAPLLKKTCDIHSMLYLQQMCRFTSCLLNKTRQSDKNKAHENTGSSLKITFWLVSGDTSQCLLFIWELVQSSVKKPKQLQTGSTAIQPLKLMTKQFFF